MSKIVLITGITGQDGSYLAELLLKKNYNVFGLVRPNFSINDTKKTWRLKNCLKDIKLYKKSLFDEDSIKVLVRKIKPDEIYHLAAQAYDGYSFRNQFSKNNSGGRLGSPDRGGISGTGFPLRYHLQCLGL